MIAMVVTFRVKPGQETVFENRIKVHRALVKEYEPGNHLYELTKTRDQPGVYVMLEIYESQAAFERHQQMPYFEETARICGATVTGPPEAQFYDVV